MKYIFDTDIGDDIDDALTLAYALEKGVDLIGITTVYREPQKRAAIAKKILQFKNKDVPVYAGYDKPINPKTVKIGKMNYTESEELNVHNDPYEAIKYIADSAEKYGEELTVLAIGEQTNLAKAWLTFPEKMKKLGRLVIMGGCFTLHHNEWNIAGDPSAAKIVAESDIKKLYVPWNVTKDVNIGEKNYDYVLGLEKDDLQGYIAKLVRDWKERNTVKFNVNGEVKTKKFDFIPILHDPLALICACNSKFYKAKKTKIAVIDEGPACGMTINVSTLNLSATQNVNYSEADIITEVNADEIVGEFMKVTFKN